MEFTPLNGKDFEKIILKDIILENKNYNYIILYQRQLYKYFTKINKYNKEYIINNRLGSLIIPDISIYDKENNILYILEVKYQRVYGSTDEKLQCHYYRKKYFNDLFTKETFKIKLIYILNDWFIKHIKYIHVLQNMLDNNINYFIYDDTKFYITDIFNKLKKISKNKLKKKLNNKLKIFFENKLKTKLKIN